MGDRKAEVAAYHGWGFDRYCWEPWRDVIPPDIDLSCFDRGYFGDSESVEFGDYGAARIVFAHSYGLHLCPVQMLSKADLLVVFGGFITFHPHAARYRRRSRLVLREMIRQMEQKPTDVLHEFWKNAYHPQPPPDLEHGQMYKSLLLDDLQNLDESTLDIETLKKPGKICILHGSSDGIVPKAKGRGLYGKFSDQSSYFEVKEAGHALPFTHPDQCWAFLKPVVQQVVENH